MIADDYLRDAMMDGDRRNVERAMEEDGRHPDKVSGRQRHHDHPDTLHHQGNRGRAGRHSGRSLATDRDSRDWRGPGEAV